MDVMDELAIGGDVIALGLLVVFVCLALLIGIIYLLAFVLRDRKKKEKKKPAPAAPVVAAAPPTAAPAKKDDAELVAAITAAIACVMQTEGNGSGFVVRSYKRSAAWGKAGREAQIYNKF